MIWALHGATGSPADWSGLQEKGTNLRRVLLWKQVAPYWEWAERFNETVREQDRRPSLLGYSMGGRLALHALLSAPELWQSAIIVSAHPGLEDADAVEQREAADEVWAERFRSGELPAVLSDWDSRPVLAGARIDRDYAETEKWRMAIADSLELWGLDRQEPLYDRLGEIACPVLWMTGSRDERYTALAERAVPLLPKGEHLVIEDCGHRVPWERTDEFAQALIGFQNRVVLREA